MAKRLKSPAVSMLVIVLGVVLLLLFLAQTKKNAAIDEKKYFETAQIEKLEIPQFTQERTSQVIEHKGFTVSYNSD